MNSTTDEIADLIEANKLNEAADAARKAASAEPDNPDYPVLHVIALIRMEKFDKALKIAERAATRYPTTWQCLSMLGQAQSYLEDWAHAEDAYRRAIAHSTKAPKEDRAHLHHTLGEMLWEQHRRDDALDELRTALSIDPKNALAKEALAEYTNVYGEPKAPTPDFDDMYHFINIHRERYFRLKGYDVFQTKEEAERILTILRQGWNTHISPRSRELDTMTAKEKSEMFSGVTIDFDEELPPSDMARTFTEEELAALHSPEEPNPTFEEMEDLTNIMFSIPLLAMVGFPKERVDEIIEGGTPTPAEEETLAWAADTVAAVFDAIEFAGTDKEAEAMMDATAFACERLAPEEAPLAVREVRRLIEVFVAKLAMSEQKKPKKRKRKNTRN